MYLIQQFIQSAVQRWPDRCAVAISGQKLTYQELDEASNILARWIQRQGVLRGSLVGFFLPKSNLALISMLGILKADCAYVPIDTSAPAARVSSIVNSAGIDLMLISNESQETYCAMGLERKVEVLNVTRRPQLDNGPIEYANLSTDIAYVLFTSGSTGAPKGVMVHHGAVIDYISWCVSHFGISQDDRLANHAPLFFDNSTFDIYCALFTGASLHLVPEPVNTMAPAMVSWVEQHEITVLFCVPSLLALILKSRRLKAGRMKMLRHVVFAGEVARPEVIGGWIKHLPNKCYTNMYGPTETTVDCTWHQINNTEFDPASAIPIGKARPNMELLIRTDDGNVVPARSANGELLVRGAAVAHGYVNQPQITRQSFIQNPLNKSFDDRLYCTGDLVSADGDGVLQFTGRADSQIKLLGHRIELGDIEAALCSLASIDDCAVVFNDGAAMDQQHIVALVETTLQAGEVTSRLKKLLPTYMIPARVICLTHPDHLPRTTNGKLDRRAATALAFAEEIQ